MEQKASDTPSDLMAFECRDHKFKAVYSVSIHGEQLRTDFRVFNTCKHPSYGRAQPPMPLA